MSGRDIERPYTLIAELTYRCALACVYCSNPLDYDAHADALDTGEWLRVFRQSEELGVLQVNLTGGEPLLRRDLESLVEGARDLDLYVNLITSGVPLEQERLVTLHRAGLDSVQLSIQDTTREGCQLIAGRDALDHKLRVAAWVKELGLPLTLNVVLHRHNLDHVGQIIELAETVGAERLELANVQYLAWALENRGWLLPARDALDKARALIAAEKARLSGKLDLVFVLPDYFSGTAKACMSGWGRRYLVVNPEGLALPCHLAQTLPGLHFENVKARALSEIWHDSPGFRAFRGEAWMPEPCRSCERRAQDFGGCRCQAFHLTGDAARADPTCRLTPDHHVIEQAHRAAPLVQLAPRYRTSSRHKTCT